MLQEIDTAITPGDIKYYKRFSGPRVPGSPNPIAVDMKKEEVAQVLISTAEARCFDETILFVQIHQNDVKIIQ